jgi:hypothetical protein
VCSFFLYKIVQLTIIYLTPNINEKTCIICSRNVVWNFCFWSKLHFLVKNFKVTGAGEVFARRYTTTLNNIPDYVFNPNYKLLSLEELRSYISTNKHLPNVPSANEFAETGVDLGELNRVLLEKVEELTLYILQLEERMKMLEAGK